MEGAFCKVDELRVRVRVKPLSPHMIAHDSTTHDNHDTCLPYTTHNAHSRTCVGVVVFHRHVDPAAHTRDGRNDEPRRVVTQPQKVQANLFAKIVLSAQAAYIYVVCVCAVMCRQSSCHHAKDVRVCECMYEIKRYDERYTSLHR